MNQTEESTQWLKLLDTWESYGNISIYHKIWSAMWLIYDRQLNFLILLMNLNE